MPLLLRFLAMLFAGTGFLAVAGFLYFGGMTSPVVSYKRISEQPIAREVVFSIPCGGAGPHLYVDQDGRLEPVFIRLAEGLDDPEDSKYAVSANRFVLEGYDVIRQHDGEAVSGRYFDLISWKPVPPYRFWRHSDGEAALEISREPVLFGIEGRELAFRPRQDSGSAVC